MKLLFIITLCTVVFLAFQDFRQRMISLYAVLLLLACTCAYTFFKMRYIEMLGNVAVNVLLLSLILVVLWGYFSIKESRRVPFLNYTIGSGDVLFLVAITPLFSPLWFLFFLQLAVVFALIGTGILYVYARYNTSVLKTIPLVGYTGVVVCIVSLWGMLADNEAILTSDSFLILKLYNLNL